MFGASDNISIFKKNFFLPVLLSSFLSQIYHLFVKLNIKLTYKVSLDLDHCKGRSVGSFKKVLILYTFFKFTY